MNPHQYWHPVLPSKDLKSKPVNVNFCGKEILIFRMQNGKIGAVDDVCAHRRMRLSKGKVEGDRIFCPYHGWSYDHRGQGSSPSTPKLKPCIRSYDATECYGAIWLKELNSDAKLIELGGAGFHQVCTLNYRIQAPLELIVDNFAEIEHTCTTHVFLGHDLEEMSAVKTEVEIKEETIRVINKGQQKKMPYLLEKILGYRKGDLFVGDGNIYFAPVCSIINNYWISPHTQQKRAAQVQGTVVFNPVNSQETEMMLFLFVSSKLLIQIPLVKRILTFLIDYETKLDKQMIEGIADKNPSLSGMQLGRFDQPLRPIREKIQRIYWGNEQVQEREYELQMDKQHS